MTKSKKWAVLSLGIYFFASYLKISISQAALAFHIVCTVIWLWKDRPSFRVRFFRSVSLTPIILLYCWGLLVSFFQPKTILNIIYLREVWLYFPVFSIPTIFMSLRQDEAKNLFRWYFYGALFTGILGVFEYTFALGVEPILKHGFSDWKKIQLQRVMGGGHVTVFMGHHLTYVGTLFFVIALQYRKWISYFENPFSAWGSRIRDAGRKFWGDTIFLAIFFVDLLGSAARSGLVATSLSLPILNFIRARKLLLPLLLAGALLGGALIHFSPSAKTRLNEMIAQKGESINDRKNIWKAALLITAEHPLIGASPESFEDEFRRLMPGVPRYYGHAHNDFLNKAASWGIPGLLIFLSIFFLPAWRLLRLSTKDRIWKDAVLTALLMFFIAGQFQCFLTDDEVIAHFALVLGIGEYVLSQATNS